MALKDWGFAPGGGKDPTVSGPTGQQERVRRMIARLPNTGLIDQAGVDSVHQFIDTLDTDASIATPIGNALLGGHADSEGNIYIPMFPDQETVLDGIRKGQTNFEVLVATEDASHPEQSINMDDVLDDSGNHFVHFKGCNIGKAPKFLSKFKEALDADHVTAPKFFHGLFWDSSAGVYEYMAYEFIVFQKTPFMTRDALIAAFTAANFTFIDGTAVPAGDWSTWVPKSITKTRSTAITPAPALGQTAGGRSQLPIGREFRVETTRRHPFTWDMTGLSPFPASSAYLSTLRADVKSAPEFTTNGFPFHERLGYATPDAFVDGLNWTFRQGKGADAGTLFATGTRSQYTLLVPITDPTDNHLVFNFHPTDPTANPPVTQMSEDNATFFGIV